MDPTYSTTDLGALPPVADDGPLGISNAGAVALWKRSDSGTVRANIWSAPSEHEVSLPAGYRSSIARGINDAGAVVGFASSSGNLVDDHATKQAFVGGVGDPRLLGTLGGRDSRAFGINSAGEIVGGASLASGVTHAFLFDGRKMEDLGTLPGGSFSQAYAVNDRSHAVGASTRATPEKRAVLWRDSHLQELGTLAGGRTSCARALNSQDQVVGYTDSLEGYHAFLWAQGQMQDLGTLGKDPSEALGINDSGDIVGASNVTATRRHAFLWRHGKMTDLNTLLAPGSGWVVTEADAISGKDQIACVGHREDGVPHALVLTPDTAVTKHRAL